MTPPSFLRSLPPHRGAGALRSGRAGAEVTLIPVVPAFTPVNLLTGFLGAGKTTLLQRLLRSPALADTAVLINEFGEIGLDHHLLERIDDTTVLLQSGCVCCTIRGELSSALRDLHARREQGAIPAFRRVVIETTGLADPLPILTTITADPVLRHHYRLGNVITVIDAVNGADQLDRQPESARQAAVADRLVLAKTDLASPAITGDLVARLHALNPSASLIDVNHEVLDADQLLSQDLSDAARRADETRQWFVPRAADANAGAREPGTAHRHGHGITSFCLVFEQPLDWTGFGIWLSMLLHRHGARVLRVKGLLNLIGEAAPVAVHGVQQLVHAPVHLRAWPDADRRSKIVFIVQGLERDVVERSLQVFMAIA